MKITKRIVALILALIMSFSACFVTSNAAFDISQPSNFEEYADFLNDGYPAISSKQFLAVVKAFNTVFRFLTGRGFIEQEHFNFTADEMLTEICTYMADETGFDILMLISSFPETNQYAEFVVETFNIDTAVMRDEILKIRDDMDAQSNFAAAALFHFLAVYMSIIDKCEAYCVPFDEMGEGNYEIYLRIITRDGTQETIGTGVIVDTVNNEIRGKDESGFLGIGYHLSTSELLLYAQVNVWMRDFGFTFLYDLFCYTTPFFFYNTRRIKFDYDGLEWMVQIWKGNYLVSNGAEVGLYNRQPGSFGTYYDCATDEQMMNMSMKLYHGEDLIFERPEQEHWWLTGFKISDTLYPARTMTLDFSIEMKDEQMLEAFCEAVENHYRHDMTYTVDGLTVNVIW